MSPVLETEDKGMLTVPMELLSGVKPHTLYVLEWMAVNAAKDNSP